MEKPENFRENPVWLFSLAASLALLLVTFFQWSLIDWLTVFLFPLLLFILWVNFLGAAIWSVVYFLIHLKRWRVSLPPVMVCAVTLALLYFVPFTKLWLDLDFVLYKSAREELVEQVLNNTLKPNVSHNPDLIALPWHAPRVSMGGNEIVVEKHEGITYVFFYTFRGILDNYSGFLYVPKGGRPEKFSDLNETDSTQLVRLDDHWFYVSHH
ncbi:MAG: hypothetical protein OEV94_00845 [Deltaproteobacteria bacterium]|nr:hypothetical protein [Deltaproteobacteria bacterium]